MRGHRLLLGVILIAVGLVTLPLTAGAVIPAASTFTTKNLTAIGYSANVVPTRQHGRRAGGFQLRPRVLGQHSRPGHVRRLQADRHLEPGEPDRDRRLDQLRPAHRVRSAHPSSEPVDDGQPG